VDILVARQHGKLEVSTQQPGGWSPQVVEPGSPDLAALVGELEETDPRWVWADTSAVYPCLLSAGVRVGRCADLRLCHAILRMSTWTRDSELATLPAGRWDVPVAVAAELPSLLDDLGGLDDVSRSELLAEHERQQSAIAAASQPGRLRLLTAAESVGGLIAAEMRHVGLPWSATVHDHQLTELVGPRPLPGGRPAVVERLVGEIRTLLGAPGLNPESQPALLRALNSAGIEVHSTRQWELEQAQHPVIEVLLQYKKLARLVSANGWTWMDAWVTDGRFHPDYVPGGVVTGRWATRGGGALQLPKQIRAAVVADPGWKLVVADAAQLEPRVLAALSADTAMARASKGADLYGALVSDGIVATRPQAKVAMLGALYGATTGEAGMLMPNLMRAYPKATGVVERAAREGERGHQVMTWLGRTSPRPGEHWRTVQERAAQPDATPADQRAARRQARDWGRFTRNFVVQGSAAEWALCWMAAIRRELSALCDDPATESVGRPDLVYFLHDEIMVHTPAALADVVSKIVRAAAGEAGRLMFGDFGVEFSIELTVADNYAQAK